MMTVEAIDAPIKDKDEAYERLVKLGEDARRTMDEERWSLGDLTLLVIAHFSVYGQRTVEEYADAIKVEASRLYEFKEVAEFYPPERRAELSELDLSYTHFREAKRLKKLDMAMEMLKQAAAQHMTVRVMAEAIKVMKLVDGIDVDRTYATPMTPLGPRYNPIKYPAWDGSVKVSFDSKKRLILEDPNIPLPPFEEGRRYRVIFEAIEE
jgi:hypothetical protein